MELPSYQLETFSRCVNGRMLIWHVPKLIEASRMLEVHERLVSEFSIDDICWFDESCKPTVRAVLEHCRRIIDADFTRPVILASDGYVMDGMHRISACILFGRQYVKVVQFVEDPNPDEEYSASLDL